MFQRDPEAEKQNPWYLKSARVLAEKMKGPMPGDALVRMLENAGVKADELKWSGLDDLRGKARVTPVEVRDHLAENALKIEEVHKGRGEKIDDESWYDSPRLEELRENDSRDPEEEAEFRRLIREGEAQEHDPTKFNAYQLPGGENYREMLLTMPRTEIKAPAKLTELPPGYEVGHDSSQPEDRKYHILPPGQVHARPFEGRHPTIEDAKEAALLRLNGDAHRVARESANKNNFTSSHWDEPNVLAHIRFNDRETPDDRKLLHLEEIQSDWHQKGRDKGYKVTPERAAELEATRRRLEGIGRDATPEQKQEWAAVMNELQPDNQSRVPDAPFKKDWHEMAFRRAVRYAAENGYDGVSWTPGEKQAERYDLSKQVDRVTYSPNGKWLKAYKDGKVVVDKYGVTPEQVPDLIGKEAARKLFSPEHTITDPVPMHEIRGADLKVGGEGMKGFYDKIIPDYARKFGKQWGAKLGETEIPEPGGADKSGYFDYAHQEGGYEVFQHGGDAVATFDTAKEAAAEVDRRNELLDRGTMLKVPILDITPEMRKSVTEQGVPMFQRQSTEERLHQASEDIRKQSLKEEESKRGKEGMKWLQEQNAAADARRRNANGKTEGPLQKEPSAMGRLQERIAEKPKAPIPLKDKLKQQTEASAKAAKDDVGKALKTAKTAMQDVWDGLKNIAKPPAAPPPGEKPVSGYMQAYGRYEEAKYRSARDHQKTAEALKAAVPDPVDQEAMTNWIQARGDKTKLKYWADNAKPAYKAGYERALKLTDTQKSIAEDFKKYYDEQEREAKHAGLLGQGKSNYMMQLYEADHGGSASLVDTTKLNDNPSIFKPSTYRNYFEAETAGMKPKNKQIGYLTGRYDELMGEAVRTRAMLSDMLNTREKDGRPSAILRRDGTVMQIGPENEPYLMHHEHADDGSDPDRRDYAMIPHPTFRKWLWQSKDLDLDDLTKKQLQQFQSADGIAMRGDILVHPDVSHINDRGQLVGHLANMLGKSAVRATVFGRVPLAVSQFAKDLMFTFAGTHEAITSTTALMEGQPPINLDNLKKTATLKGWANPLDMDDKILDIDHGPDAEIKQLGVRNGLTLLDIAQEEGWSEGGMMSGAMKYLGPPGRLMVDYKNFLFRNVMPKIKMKMFVERYKADAERYGKTKTPDEIAENTARQVNSMVGGINWQRMGVSKTAVDLARLAFLAPDFQWGAVTSGLQALTPGGRQQLMVFARTAMIMYGTARIINAIANQGDAKWDKQDAFRLVVDGKHYGIRTRIGDAWEMANDPQLYFAHRLNPVFARTALEAITRKDEYGRAKSAGGIGKDAVTNTLPIALAPLTKNEDLDWQQTFLNSAGIQTGKYYTPTETLAHKLRIGHIPQGGADAEEDEAQAELSREHRHLKEKIRDGSMSPSDLWNMVQDKKLTPAEASRIQKSAMMTPLQEDTQALPLAEAMKVYAAANRVEREQLHDLIVTKAQKEQGRHPDTAEAVEEKMEKLMAENK